MQTKPTELKGKGINLKNISEIGKGAISLKFDLEIASMEMTLRECLLIKNSKENTHFLTFPSKEYEKDGVMKRYSYITMPPERKKRLEKLVIETVTEYYVLP